MPGGRRKRGGKFCTGGRNGRFQIVLPLKKAKREAAAPPGPKRVEMPRFFRETTGRMFETHGVSN